MSDKQIKQEFLSFMVSKRITDQKIITDIYKQLRKEMSSDDLLISMSKLRTKKTEFLEVGDFFEALNSSNDDAATIIIENAKAAIRKYGHLQPSKVKDSLGLKAWEYLGGYSGFYEMCHYRLDDTWKWKQVKDRVLTYLRNPEKASEFELSSSNEVNKLLESTIKEVE